jgi:hypothetical protein
VEATERVQERVRLARLGIRIVLAPAVFAAVPEVHRRGVRRVLRTRRAGGPEWLQAAPRRRARACLGLLLKLANVLDDERNQAYYEHAVLLAISGLSHLFLDFAVLVAAAIGTPS